MAWYSEALQRLKEAGICQRVELVGGKIRGWIDETTFVDLYYDPTSGSYSYALIDLKLPYAGDKRVFGWDDYPHEGVPEIEALESYPHHFQRRDETGAWIFEESPAQGEIQAEVDLVISMVRTYLSQQ